MHIVISLQEMAYNKRLFFLYNVRLQEDCAVRLMDVNQEVCKSYQQLIKALPTDILTRFETFVVSNEHNSVEFRALKLMFIHGVRTENNYLPGVLWGMLLQKN